MQDGVRGGGCQTQSFAGGQAGGGGVWCCSVCVSCVMEPGLHACRVKKDGERCGVSGAWAGHVRSLQLSAARFVRRCQAMCTGRDVSLAHAWAVLGLHFADK